MDENMTEADENTTENDSLYQTIIGEKRDNRSKTYSTIRIMLIV